MTKKNEIEITPITPEPGSDITAAEEPPPPAPRGRKGPIAIRLDPETLDRLKTHADKLNVGYQTLLKSLLLRGLNDLDNASFITFPSGMRKKRKDLDDPAPDSVPEIPADRLPDPEPAPTPRHTAVKTDLSDADVDDMFQNMS